MVCLDCVGLVGALIEMCRFDWWLTGLGHVVTVVGAFLYVGWVIVGDGIL